MSWDATLIDERGHVRGEWNYTHNTNPIVNHALGRVGIGGDNWIAVMDGLDGPSGARILDAVIRELLTHADVYASMQPKNGWGSLFDEEGGPGIVSMLQRMRDAVPEWPTVWHIDS